MNEYKLSPQFSVFRHNTSTGLVYILNINGKYYQGYTSLDAITKDIQAIIEGTLIPEAGT